MATSTNAVVNAAIQAARARNGDDRVAKNMIYGVEKEYRIAAEALKKAEMYLDRTIWRIKDAERAGDKEAAYYHVLEDAINKWLPYMQKLMSELKRYM